MSPDATKTSLGTGRILPDGTVLAERYRILRLLGVGGMGMVYLAHDEELGIDVAVKVLRPGGAATEMRLERFRSELVLARQISHRNVVRIHDIGQSGDLYFITMDYVDGESLKHVLEVDGALDAARATAIAADLADALAEAHRSEVVHRDIKPGNVLLGDDRAYLTDFGIARSLHADGLTRTGEVIGTLDYLSPEQARGGDIDGRADIYALGLLLFEMLTGKRPFTGETADEVLAQRTLASPRELTARHSSVPAQLRRVITRCLAVDPADRYQDAADLARDLRAGTASWNLRKPLRRAAAAAAVIGAIAVLWALWPLVKPDAVDVAEARPIAVLPFEVAVNSADLGSVSQGLAELLSENLSSFGGVQVVASQRVAATLRDLRLSPDDLTDSDFELLADLLDADYVVSGQVQQIDDVFLVEARLRRSVSGDIVHRASYNVDTASDVFAAMVPVSAELLSNLDVPVATDTAVLSGIDADAFASFSAGVAQLSRGNAVEAVQPLRAAVEKAPQFALAWDRLAQALALLGRDREALDAAESAVQALGGGGGRSGALVRAHKEALAGSPDRAIAVLETLLAESPDDGDARFMLAEVYGDAGRLQDAESALLEVVESSPDHPQAWYLLGKFAILRGESRRAIDDYLVKALVIQNRLGNDPGKADALNAMGIAHDEVGDSAAAADYYEQALELRRRIGDDRGVAAVLANLARISLRQGEFDRARDELRSARDTLADIGDRWTVANLENELGYLEEQRGRFVAALDHYREALRIRDGLGDQRALAESYNNIGYTYYLLGQYDNAAVFVDRSLETYRETDNSEGVMFASQIRGILETARGRYDDALKALLEALRISREIDAAHAEAVTEGYIGNARFLQGKYAAARSSFDGALEKLGSIGDDRTLAGFMLHDAELSLATGMTEAAGERVAKARELLADVDSASSKALLLRVEGELLAAQGLREQAVQRFDAALEAAEASGEQAAILDARLNAASLLTADARAAALREVRTASQRLGHGYLAFESAVVLAESYLDSGDADRAEQVLRDRPYGEHGDAGYHGDYRYFTLLAETYAAQDRRDAADDAWRRAAECVERALAAQDAPQQQSFSQLDAVRRVLERENKNSDS